MALFDLQSLLDERIDPLLLDEFQEQYESQRRRGPPSSIAQFNYANALIRSTKADVKDGINMLEALIREGEDDTATRDYVYFLALANARIGEFDRSLSYVNHLLSSEPQNRQALELKNAIEKKMKREGLIGAAIVGGGAVVVGGIIAALFASRK